jgi:hypothetical protein
VLLLFFVSYWEDTFLEIPCATFFFYTYIDSFSLFVCVCVCVCSVWNREGGCVCVCVERLGWRCEVDLILGNAFFLFFSGGRYIMAFFCKV